MLEVCCALIFHGGKLLVVQRAAGSDHPGQWEFPGGKIEADETAVACIRREISEELEVAIQVEAYLFPQTHDYGFKQIRLHPFVCRASSLQFQLNEHDNLQWIGPDEWRLLDWQEADFELIERNEATISEWFGKNNDDGREQ